MDTLNMLAEIDGLPQQLAKAYSNSSHYSLQNIKKPDIVLVAGMGGSAIGADLISSYCSPFSSVPIISLREYTLPAWAAKQNTLVVTSSHSGNTEETLSVFDEALKTGLSIITIATGGEISKKAREANIPVWEFEHHGQPRAAVGFSFGILLALLERLELIPSQQLLVEQAVSEIEKKQEGYKADVPIVKNAVKRLAGQAVGRQVAVFGSDHLAPVARRWKTQINELAKAWAQFEFLPEADHNTLAGVENDASILEKTMVLFLKGGHMHPRNLLRVELTRQEMMVAGMAVDAVDFKGVSRLAEMWDAILFGDYFAYYLALAYDADPTPIEALSSLKKAMKK
ncbi:MAG: bifunctional phosphoglucose/phosphomannose isomerase [Anaerolineaceae bacterium]